MKTIITKKVSDKLEKVNNDNKCYYIYILKCENGILYTGVTTDYKRRFNEHSRVNGSKNGAKFTKSHKPKKIVALWKTSGRSNAQKLETRIKQLSKADKLNLISDNKTFKIYFNDLLDCKLYKIVRKGEYA